MTNFSEEPRRLDFQFVAEGIETDDKTAAFSMRLEAGQQEIVPEVVDELAPAGGGGAGIDTGLLCGGGVCHGGRGRHERDCNRGPDGLRRRRRTIQRLLQRGALRFSLQRGGLGGRTAAEPGRTAATWRWSTPGEVDESPSVFHLEIYDGETGLLADTVVTRPVPARGWHQINGILGSYAPQTRQGYIRIEKVSGENPFLAYGVVNDGGAPESVAATGPTCQPANSDLHSRAAEGMGDSIPGLKRPLREE